MTDPTSRPRLGPRPAARTNTSDAEAATLSPLRLNLMRAGYALMGIGLVLVKWPLLPEAHTLPLHESVTVCLLTAMSLLAFLVPPISFLAPQKRLIVVTNRNAYMFSKQRARFGVIRSLRSTLVLASLASRNLSTNAPSSSS